MGVRNSGSQASSLIIRALALREITLSDWWKVLKRELISGLALGGFLGALGLIRIHIWQYTGMANYTVYYHQVGVTIMCAVLGIVLWGCIVGAMLPFVLKKVKLDPATSSAPFVATLVDVTGIVIYLSVAMLVLRGTLLKPPTFVEEQIPAGMVEAVVRDSVADPQGQAFVEIIVQTDDQTAGGRATRVRVPISGIPDGKAPANGTKVRMMMEADHASKLEVVE